MIFLILYAFGCELWAPWSEELGRKPILQLSLFLVNIWQIPVGIAPNFATIMVGREREMDEACSLLGQHTVRLLTISGPGGVGKTRLALVQASVELHSAYIALASCEVSAEVKEAVTLLAACEERRKAIGSQRHRRERVQSRCMLRARAPVRHGSGT